ncbi:hypothetical protein CP532_3151 [Ophiocordyceps camponoti-leonardi (nom. inval.)]|nr:hypothetical protein CP532_3151 [Ophiocordyceps camponoti-leonardi (nom. inval.)]
MYPRWPGDEWEIDEILSVRWVKVGRGRRREVLVRWTGYLDPTWEPLAALDRMDALERFEALYGPATYNDGAPLGSTSARKTPVRRQAAPAALETSIMTIGILKSLI